MSKSTKEEKDLLTIFENTKVLLWGHFELTSKRHSNIYINKDSIFSDPVVFGDVTFEMSQKLQIAEDIENLDFDIITGPAIAGAILAAPIAIDCYRIFVYPEKIKNKMIFRRGYDKKIPGKKVVIIEDVITTGSSVQKTIDAVKELGGTVVKVVTIWNRTGWKPKECEVVALINQKVGSWKPSECPLCARDFPLQDPKFL